MSNPTVPSSAPSDSAYLRALADHVLVYDGAMGTNIQLHHPTPEDFGGKALEGCNDHLVVAPGARHYTLAHAPPPPACGCRGEGGGGGPRPVGGARAQTPPAPPHPPPAGEGGFFPARVNT